MKKNININLFGTLYAIDEDACKLLENYLDKYRLRIGCHDVKGGSAVCGRMLLAHIGLRKQ